jgi:hypothetical protein
MRVLQNCHHHFVLHHNNQLWNFHQISIDLDRVQDRHLLLIELMLHQEYLEEKRIIKEYYI